jgi:hypothetical protein
MIHRLRPGFKACCLTVCLLYVFLAGGLFVKGLMTSMADFQVPAELLTSAYYYDAMVWVYSHMIILGLVIGAIGFLGKDHQLKIWMTRLLCIVHVYYTYLDFRTSDSAVGNGLYKGPGSIIPGFICLFITLLFLQLVLLGEPLSRQSTVADLQRS